MHTHYKGTSAGSIGAGKIANVGDYYPQHGTRRPFSRHGLLFRQKGSNRAVAVSVWPLTMFTDPDPTDSEKVLALASL